MTKRILLKLGEESVKEIAWDVIPDLAEAMIKKRIYQLENAIDGEK